MKFLVYHNRTTYFGKLSLHLERCSVLPKGRKRLLNETLIVKVSVLGYLCNQSNQSFQQGRMCSHCFSFCLANQTYREKKLKYLKFEKIFCLIQWQEIGALKFRAGSQSDSSVCDGHVIPEWLHKPYGRIPCFLFVLTCLLWLPLWFVANCVFYPGSSIINCWESLTSFYSWCHAQAARSDSAVADSKEEIVKA